jgi:hypothetical protein
MTPLDYLGAAVLLLLLITPCVTGWRVYRRADVRLKDPGCFTDAQTAARRLRLATFNQPAAKGLRDHQATIVPIVTRKDRGRA